MDEQPIGHTTLVDRAKAILLKPKDEWPAIDRDPTPSGEIFTHYLMPLAAIGPVCSFLGGQLFGYGAFWFSYRPSLTWALSGAIGRYVATLIGVIVLSLIANWLAPKFEGQASQRSAFKLVAYSMTAGCIAGVFSLIPSLGFLALLGLYSLYLFYVGAGPLLKIPQDKVMPFTAVTFVVTIVLGVIVSAVFGAVGGAVGAGMGLFGSHSYSSDRGDISINGPGGGVTIDTSKIEQAARNVEEAVKTGNAKAVAPADLQALLPASIGAYKRTATESMLAGPAGSRAEGTYEAGDKRFTLSVADMSAMGAIAGIGAAMGVESNKEDADGYEHTTTQDGHLVTEKWRKSGSGEFGTMVGKRFFIQAQGDANSIDELKGAVASIDAGRLAALAP